MGVTWQDGGGGDPSDRGARKGLSEEMRITEARAYTTRSRWPSQGTGGSDQSKPPWGRSKLGCLRPGSGAVSQSGRRHGGWEGGKARSPLGAA